MVLSRQEFDIVPNEVPLINVENQKAMAIANARGTLEERLALAADVA